MGEFEEAGGTRLDAPDWSGVEPDGADAGPRRFDEVRTALTPAVLLAAGAVAFLLGHWVVGAVLCVLATGTFALQVGLGALFTKYVLKRGANVFRLLAQLTQPGVAHRAGQQGGPDSVGQEDDPEAQVDRAVGFGLTRAAARGGFFCAGMDEGLVARRRDNVLAERAATYEWLQSGPAWQEVSVVADDGARLVGHAWVGAPEGGRWAVLCHGYAGTWDSMLQYARHWAQAGFNLLLPCMRCHGGSEGALIGMGVPDGADVAAWARGLERGLGQGMPKADQAVLMGHSMGGHAVLLASASPGLPACVRAVVADCAFDRVWGSLARLLDQAGLPVHPTLEIARRHLRHVRGGFDIAADDACAALRRGRVPVFLAHGLADGSVPAACAKRLYEAAAQPCGALLVPGAGHCQASLVAPNAYWDAVLGFVRAQLR